MLTKNDIELIKTKGITRDQLESQIQNFKKGFPYSKLYAPATVGNGIIKFDDEITELVDFFNSKSLEKDLLKFVPASGAASRMFKHLFEFREQLSNGLPPVNQDDGFNSATYFFKNLSRFAFFNDLSTLMESQGKNTTNCLKTKDYKPIIDGLLNQEGLQYASLPKALLKFHHYRDGSRLAIEEHLVEGAVYSRNSKDIVKIHFTVSPEHLDKFKTTVNEVSTKYETIFNVKFNIGYSVQKPSSDMIAVDMQNQPLRNAAGNLVFRPGGHGALIENLNDIEGDIIFIKNIDNIVPDRIRETTYVYKKVIAAHLIRLQEQTFKYLKKLNETRPSDQFIKEVEKFAHEKLFIDLVNKPEGEEITEFLTKKLNRPIRVCGMVKNQGEPGGGPFWVMDKYGEKSLQIIESSQINMTNKDQKDILKQSTHFNPVDLVCGIRDYKGNKFNLKNFIDPETGFISIKSQDGKELKAQELPGLWNGAMADWITIFVECPIITFNPVKTINDLLREQHQ